MNQSPEQFVETIIKQIKDENYKNFQVDPDAELVTMTYTFLGHIMVKSIRDYIAAFTTWELLKLFIRNGLELNETLPQKTLPRSAV